MIPSFSQDKLQLLALAGVAATIMVMFAFAKWRFAVKLAFVIVIFEGAIRKWLLPQGQELVYFLKDVVLLGVYGRFFLFPDPQTRAQTAQVPVAGILFTFGVVALWAMHPNLGSPILGIYGLKNYFYYLPLLLVVPHVFRDEQSMLNYLSRYSLLAIPVCLLGAFQFFAPSNSMINVYAHDAAGGEVVQGALMGAKQFSRITGTFSYISGLVTFVQVFTCIALVCIVSSTKRYQIINSYVCLPLLLAAGYMSGSRTAVFSQIAIIATFVVAGSAMQLGRRSSTALKLILILGVAAGGSMYVFREAANAFYERAVMGDDSIKERFLNPIAVIGDAMQEGGGLGGGVGVTHPACRALRSFLGLPNPAIDPQYESEPAQIMAELGIIGFAAWYWLRFVLLTHSWKLFRSLPPGPTKPLCLCVVLLQIVHFMAQLVYNHVASFLVWGLYGLTLVPTIRARYSIARRHAPLQRPNPAS